MKQKSLNLGSSLTRNEIKKVNGGKIKSAKYCHDRIDGLSNICLNGCCRTNGTGACDPNNENVCFSTSFSYCCCQCGGGCTTNDDCSIH